MIRRAAAVLAFELLWPSAAAANGRYPLANQLVIDPANPAHMVARATFGILDSNDAGQTWRWVCEDAVGYFGQEDPPVAIMGDGSVVVASSRGIAVSRDGGCSWNKRTVDGGIRTGVDVTVDPANPHQALALESSFATGRYEAILVRTADDAATWADVGAIVAGAVVETLEMAPSNPDRVYVTARLSPDQLTVLLRSDDGGQTFTQFPMNLPPGAAAFIGAVDPRDADVVYVRAKVPANTIGRVLVTHDGGATWNVIWMGAGDVAGFALSDDGATVAIGGPESGLRIAATSDMAFREANAVRPSCLTWSGGKLFACAKEAVDFFSIGVSDDDGAHFQPIMHLPDITPQSCGSSTSAAVCWSSWRPIAETIGADAGVSATDAGDGGSGGPNPPADDASGGCASTRMRPARGAATTWALGAILAWLAMRFRRLASRHPERHPGRR